MITINQVTDNLKDRIPNEGSIIARVNNGSRYRDIILTGSETGIYYDGFKRKVLCCNKTHGHMNRSALIQMVSTTDENLINKVLIGEIVNFKDYEVEEISFSEESSSSAAADAMSKYGLV